MTFREIYNHLWRVRIMPSVQDIYEYDWIGEIKQQLNPVALGKYFLILLELGLLVLIFREFQIVNQIFYERIAIIALVGFAINYFLPGKLRLPFFVFISIVGIRAVFGVDGTIWLVGIGLILIVICHLPIPFWSRIVLLILTGIFLGFSRTDQITTPIPTVIWPILASMFMFRLIVYMYDLKHSKGSINLSSTLSYFFMLPNVVFPLFPIVDYSTFQRTYYNDDQHSIYQKGIQWIFRGIVQLIIYRFVYYYLTISPNEVLNIADFIRYAVSLFLLYLRVSGSFHLIIGMLHLFGFNLPETNHNYLLANSFTDFWRRANIYWKDFMMKVFYYPTYFRLRERGGTLALIGSTIIVFLVTWALHSYQWFWLRGSFLISFVDIIFWIIFGLLVVINVFIESRRGRKRSLQKQSWTLERLVPVALRTLGTFAAIIILWSFWNSASISEWLSLFNFSGDSIEATTGLLPIVLLGSIFLGKFSWGKRRNSQQDGGRKPIIKSKFLKSFLITSVSLLFLYLIGNPSVSNSLPSKLQEVIRDVRVDGLNRQDIALLQRGYYEDLTRADRLSSQLWEVYMKRTAFWPIISETEASEFTGDFLKLQLRPYTALFFHGAPLRTNRWGMRDQEYELDKPAATYRMALLGGSHVMGSGVADNQTFDTLVEDRLNQIGGGYARYELLNFGVASYSPPQRLWILERKALHFNPDAVLYFAHNNDVNFAVRHLAEMIQSGVDIPYPQLNEIVRKSGINRETPQAVSEKNLTTYGTDILSWTYKYFVETSQENGALPVWVLLGSPGVDPPKEEIAFQKQVAEQAGFVILDASDVYQGRDATLLRVAEWDWHPNELGHRLIAEKLFELLYEEDIPLELNSAE